MQYFNRYTSLPTIDFVSNISRIYVGYSILISKPVLFTVKIKKRNYLQGTYDISFEMPLLFKGISTQKSC